MTESEFLALEPRERDALVGRSLGHKPEIIHIVTDDGGKTATAFTGTQAWRNLRELQEWFANKRARGMLSDYEIGQWEAWPDYTTTYQDMGLVIEKMLGLNYSVRLVAIPREDRFWLEEPEVEDEFFECEVSEFVLDDSPPFGKRYSEYMAAFAQADTAPLAVALATLKALKVVKTADTLADTPDPDPREGA
jgi:hypothetical protein